MAGVRTTFAWDGAHPIAQLLNETNTTTGAVTSYIYGPDGLPLEQITGSTVTWLHHDQLGSTRLLTNGTGATVGSFTYDPYGNPSTQTGPATTNLRYAGEYTDTETGLIYLRARYYDPATGQFLTRDPVSALTRSAYGYVDGNPLNYVDPSGLFRVPGTDWCIGKCKTSNDGEDEPPDPGPEPAPDPPLNEEDLCTQIEIAVDGDKLYAVYECITPEGTRYIRLVLIATFPEPDGDDWLEHPPGSRCVPEIWRGSPLLDPSIGTLRLGGAFLGVGHW